MSIKTRSCGLHAGINSYFKNNFVLPPFFISFCHRTVIVLGFQIIRVSNTNNKHSGWSLYPEACIQSKLC